MAQEFRVAVDLAQLLELGPVIRAQVFANLGGAVESVAQAGVERWKTAVLNTKLWEGERRAYADSIRYHMSGAFSAEIVSDYKYVEDIETGRPAYDLKRMLQTSFKTRLSKKGQLYLIIPFRHNTPGASGGMPEAVYASARKLKVSTIVGHGERVGGRGAYDEQGHLHLVRTRKYVWGGRLGTAAGPRKLPMQGPGVKGASAHKNDRYDGMVRMQTSSGKQNSSAYLTFRVMKEGSPGWIIPARPGLWIARAVAESLQRTADIDFPAAVQKDLDAA